MKNRFSMKSFLDIHLKLLLMMLVRTAIAPGVPAFWQGEPRTSSYGLRFPSIGWSSGGSTSPQRMHKLCKTAQATTTTDALSTLSKQLSMTFGYWIKFPFYNVLLFTGYRKLDSLCCQTSNELRYFVEDDTHCRFRDTWNISNSNLLNKHLPLKKST